MGFLCLSSQIEVLILPLISGSHFRKVLVLNLTLEKHFIHRRILHPQIDSQAEHTIQTLEDMLRTCMIDFKGNLDDHLPHIEFANNNNYHSSN